MGTLLKSADRKTAIAEIREDIFQQEKKLLHIDLNGKSDLTKIKKTSVIQNLLALFSYKEKLVEIKR